jgi:hypothetical protein
MYKTFNAQKCTTINKKTIVRRQNDKFQLVTNTMGKKEVRLLGANT